jgi:hypothetical protein
MIRLTHVYLFSRSGDRVADFDIPAFDAYPEVVIWKKRVFWQETRKGNMYSEVTAWTVPISAATDE